MTFQFIENKWGIDLNLVPETPAECAQLLRFANNAKAVKPNIYFSFSTDTPNLQINMEKVKEKVQYNSINPARKSK